MSDQGYPSKPGDTFTAKAIGTWPMIPDPSLDQKEYDSEFWAEHQFRGLPEGVTSLITFGGPRGVVAVALEEGIFTHYQDHYGGTILRQVRWDHTTMTWVPTALDPPRST